MTDNLAQHSRDQWQRPADGWAADAAARETGPARVAADRMLTALAPEPGEHVLAVACGGADLGLRAADTRAAIAYAGFDVEHVRRLRLRPGRMEPSVPFVLGRARPMTQHVELVQLPAVSGGTGLLVLAAPAQRPPSRSRNQKEQL